jgi:hypothetical protein
LLGIWNCRKCTVVKYLLVYPQTTVSAIHISSLHTLIFLHIASFTHTLYCTYIYIFGQTRSIEATQTTAGIVISVLSHPFQQLLLRPSIEIQYSALSRTLDDSTWYGNKQLQQMEGVCRSYCSFTSSLAHLCQLSLFSLLSLRLHPVPNNIYIHYNTIPTFPRILRSTSNDVLPMMIRRRRMMMMDLLRPQQHSVTNIRVAVLGANNSIAWWGNN